MVTQKLSPSTAISLRKHLETLGWEERYLDKTGYFARLGIKDWDACFEPFSLFQRFLIKNRLPVQSVISPNTRVKFLASLKHDVIGSGPPLSLLRIFIIASKIFGYDLTAQPTFEGFIQGNWFDEFPFDEWLIVSAVNKFDAIYIGPDDRVWTIRHIALTCVTQIEIWQPDHKPMHPFLGRPEE